nr:MAG TPA: PROTEIN, Synthetic Peptide, Heterotrimer, DE [Caudoviricetes sp.]
MPTYDCGLVRGPAGPAGLIGDTGAPGATGLIGDTGPVGYTGATGDVGPRGNPGPSGSIGPAGPAGLIGDVGPAGLKGPTGDTGLAGLRGAAGLIGPTGARGLIGNTGPIGPTGPAGATGSTGASGTVGDFPYFRGYTYTTLKTPTRSYSMPTQVVAGLTAIEFFLGNVRNQEMNGSIFIPIRGTTRLEGVFGAVQLDGSTLLSIQLALTGPMVLFNVRGGSSAQHMIGAVAQYTSRSRA